MNRASPDSPIRFLLSHPISLAEASPVIREASDFWIAEYHPIDTGISDFAVMCKLIDIESNKG